MKLGRRPTLAIMAALILFNVLLRYPRSEHEVDVDSFFEAEVSVERARVLRAGKGFDAARVEAMSLDEFYPVGWVVFAYAGDEANSLFCGSAPQRRTHGSIQRVAANLAQMNFAGGSNEIVFAQAADDGEGRFGFCHALKILQEL